MFSLRSILRTSLILIAAISIGFSANAFTVIIDAGHGGHDSGAPGLSINEKDINLAVAKKLARLLSSHEDIKVVMTRSDDRFIPLQGRADIANRNKGNLFVSIHTNSVDVNNKNRQNIQGASVYVLGLDRTQENLAVAMRENSAITLERDYTSKYQGFDPKSAESYIIFELAQNRYMQQSINAAKEMSKQLATTAGRRNNGVKQANFWVLLKTAMPSVLVELDFICNPTCEQYMASENGQKKLSQALYNGVLNFKNNTSSLTSKKDPSPHKTEKDSSPTHDKNRTITDTSTPTEGPIVFKIQFLTYTRILAEGANELKGTAPVEHYKAGNSYKYTYGQYKSAKDANADLMKIRALFPDAFIIKTVGGKRIQ